MLEGNDQDAADVASAIVAQCEQLDYKQRMRHMVDLGRQAKTDAVIRTALDVLHHSSLYEQLLALQSCYGSRDPITPVQALTSSSCHIRKRASRLAALVGPDEQLFNALMKMTQRGQAKLLYCLKSYGRIEIIDRFIDSLSSSAKPLTVRQHHRCLQFASTQKIASYLGSMIFKAGASLRDTEWVALARVQPQAVLEPFYRIMVRDTPPKDQDVTSWVATINKLLLLLRDVSNTEHSVMDLIRIILQRHKSARLDSLESIARRYHETLAGLLLRYDAARIPSFGWASRKLPTGVLLNLAAKSLEETITVAGSGLFNASFLKSSWGFLTPKQKVKFYDAASMQNMKGHILASYVEDLPQHQQILEARSQISHSASRPGEVHSLEWNSFLPWDEAVESQREYLMSSFATTRAHAAEVQIVAAGRKGGDCLLYQKAIELVLRKRNEQNSVRLAMLQALCALPSRSWTQEHLPGLEQIIRHALNATDLSRSSSTCLANLVVKLLSVNPPWTWRQMMVIYGERGIRPSSNVLAFKSNPSFGQSLALLAAAALPMLRKWQKNAQQSNIYWLAETFFKDHLDIFPELEEALIGPPGKILGWNYIAHLPSVSLKHATRLTKEFVKLLGTTESENFASSILRALLKEFPLATQRRILDLVAEDPTWIACQPVKSYLIDCRQDMLAPYLTSTRWKGRFNKDQGLLSIRIKRNNASQLTAHQQSLAADEMTRHLSDGSQLAQGLKHDLRLLSYLHLIEPERLASFADDERPLVQRFAISNLEHLDSGEGFAKLRECLADNRARYAVHSLGSVLTTVSSAEALSVLRGTSLGTVTVAKEVVRRVAELLTQEAFEYLLELEKQDLHFDIRVTLLSNLCLYYRDRLETWQVLINTARGEEKLAREVTPLVITQVHTVLDNSALQLMQTLLNHPAGSVRENVLSQLTVHRIQDINETLFPRVEKLIDSSHEDERFAAAWMIFICYHSHIDTIIKFLDGLTGAKQLDRALNYYRNAAQNKKNDMLSTTLAVLNFLEQGRLNTGRQVDVILNCLPWEDMADQLFSTAPKLHADALVRAEGIIVSFAYARRQNDDTELDRLGAKLGSGDSEISRRLGLAALEAVTNSNHRVNERGGWGRLWTEERRERLRLYQEDESAMVAEAASKLRPPSEE